MTRLDDLLARTRALGRTGGVGAALALVDQHGAARLGLDPATTVLAGYADGLPAPAVLGPAAARQAVLPRDYGALVVPLDGAPRESYVEDLLLHVPAHSTVAKTVEVPAGWLTEVELLRAALVAGLMRRALEHAAKVLLTHAHPWHEAPVESADRDPHTQGVFGQAFAVLAATESLLAEARPGPDESVADPAVAARTSLARRYADRRGGEVVNQVIGVLGASSATDRLGLDAHWRALRGLSSLLPPASPTLEGVPA